MLTGLLFVLGVTSANRWPYLFWSGILGDTTIFAAVWVWYYRANCHRKGCWRTGHLKAGPYVVCHKHHPEHHHKSRNVPQEKIDQAWQSANTVAIDHDA